MSDPDQGISSSGARPEPWPSLPLDSWRDTLDTLHMMTQVAGKIRLACAPMVNHWWQVPLYVSARGLTTSAVPHGSRTFQIDFDLIDHVLRIEENDGGERAVTLSARPIALFYREVMQAMQELELPVRIWTRPNEVEEAIPFEEDYRHDTYEPDHARRLWEVLRHADRVFGEFRSGFVGKCSPVHFFWGGFDLALTRFSGRRAPEHPGGIPNLADHVVREAYSHECISCGYWFGGGPVREPAFFAYAYPEPTGFREYPVLPGEAYYSDELREFILPYEAVRSAAEPDRTLHAFLRSTYQAGAELGGWNRTELESDPRPGHPGASP